MTVAHWNLYTGDAEPHNVVMPTPPPWRQFDGGAAESLPSGAQPALDGPKFRATREVIDAVNTALHLRRPLLVTGRPGTGKSSLIDSVAWELRLGSVLRWHVTSRSTLQDALYRYDAIGRLQAAQIEGKRGQSVPITQYLRLGPLGTAMLPSEVPRALLIDEIDKSEIDLPNDLLNIFERGEFEIPELARLDVSDVDVRKDASDELVSIHSGKVRCLEFPFVVLTSNGERDFPPAFLRRCIRLRIPDPGPAELAEIVRTHLGSDAAAAADELINNFAEESRTREQATDQLMNAVYLVTHRLPPQSQEREDIIRLVLRELTPDSL